MSDGHRLGGKALPFSFQNSTGAGKGGDGGDKVGFTTPLFTSAAAPRCATHLVTTGAVVFSGSLNSPPQRISFKGPEPEDGASPPRHSADKSSPSSRKRHTCAHRQTLACAHGRERLPLLSAPSRGAWLHRKIGDIGRPGAGLSCSPLGVLCEPSCREAGRQERVGAGGQGALGHLKRGQVEPAGNRAVRGF